MTNNHILCVPMRVEAMMVGKSPVPTVFANIPDDYSRITLNPLGDYVPSGIMNEKTEEKPGIHLHWTLPEALRQGQQNNEHDAPEFPSVPNRWIVTRIWASVEQPDSLHSKYWIVESDALEKRSSPELGNEGSLTFPKLDDLQWPYRILGRSYPYEAIIHEPLERLVPFHAIGPGNPAFSAMYPYHRNVFGFYDDLTDEAGARMQNVSISYVVRGFYDNELPLVTSAHMCREQLGWEAPKALSYPASIALHGVVTSLDWENDQIDYNGTFINKQLTMPELAVGNTSAEAVSALHAVKNRSNERLMRVLLHDQSHKLLNLNGIYHTDYTEHDRRFQLYAEQHEYKLQSKITDKEYADIPELSDDDQTQFRQLQEGMNEQYRKQFSIQAKRSAVYDLWCKYMIKVQVTDPFEIKEAKKLAERYQQELEAEILALQQEEMELKELQDRLRLLEQQLTHAISEHYELKQNAGERYYEPNSPVLLLSGSKRGALFETQSSAYDENRLLCRLPQESVQELRFDFTLRGIDHSVIIHANLLLQETVIKGNYAELLLEAVLFCKNSAERIAAIVGEQLGLLPFTEAEKKQLLADIHQLQNSMDSGLVKPGERFPDPLFLNHWTAPWNPVLLSWRGLYYPDKELIGRAPKLSHWTFDGVDYKFDSTIDTAEAVVMEGKILLTPHIAQQLQAMTVKQIGVELTQAIGALHELDYLSQSLDGFNARFAMSQQTLRFPVFVLQKGSAELAAQVRLSLGEFEMEKPLFNTFFSPLRGGFFKFDQLRLIDTFGQFQEITATKYAIAENLRTSSDPIGKLIMLPPRFIQPTRLEFNWFQGRGHNYCDFNLPDSPICGWLIPNHADQSLLIYDEEGNMLGSLIVTAYDGDAVQWRNAPGSPDVPLTSQNSSHTANLYSADLPESMNPEMKAFLSEILRRSHEHEDVLTPFLQLIDSALWDVHAHESPSAGGLSLYAGKPLVLTKANIKLVQAGPPDRYKAIDSNTKQPAPVPDISIKQFEMPLWIGEQHHLGDGVIGFFKQDGVSGYKHFNSAFAPSDHASDYLYRNNQVDISADEQSDGTTVSIIMDPLASMHLISGMLPVSVQRIPQDRIESALNRLFLTLYVGPLLVGEENIVMPLTKLPNREWSFITPSDAEAWAEAWIETKNLQPSNGNAFLAKSPFRAVEGWLKLNVRGDDETDA
ncbi:hypothetical protein ACFP56_05300 [Paenibacillus septentrionalis]|uniref:Uncharacterized protein n=1 Tax=Paenibacillus septentrionalis TaxID=429342 RepID=A0ABW1V0P7_9BACL